MTMILEAENDRPQVSVGTHPARLYMIADLGTQKDQFEGQEPTFWRKLLFNFEIKDEFTDDGKPLAISKEYNLALGETSNLHKDVLSWTGEKVHKGYVIDKLIGEAALIGVGPNKNGNSKITSVGKPMKGLTIEPLVNRPVSFKMPPLGEYNDDEFNILPKWIRAKIEKSPQYMEIKGIQQPSQAQPAQQRPAPARPMLANGEEIGAPPPGHPANETDNDPNAIAAYEKYNRG